MARAIIEEHSVQRSSEAPSISHRPSRTAWAAVLFVALIGALLPTLASPKQAAAVSGVTPIASLTIDCSTLPGYTDSFNWVSTTTPAAVTLTKCDSGFTYTLFNDSGEIVPNTSVTSDPYTFNWSAEQELMLWGPSYSPFMHLFSKPAYPKRTPSGTLQKTTDLQLGSSAPQVDFGPEDSEGDGEHVIGGITECDVEADADGSLHPYATVQVNIATAGTYTFRGIITDPIGSYLDPEGSNLPIRDPFLALYSGFDPTKPNDGVVGCNDDFRRLPPYDTAFYDELGELNEDGTVIEGHLPLFTATLAPGTYTLMLTVWDNISSGDWETLLSGESLTSASVTFEMWGPSLCLVGDPGCTAPPTTCGKAPTSPQISAGADATQVSFSAVPTDCDADRFQVRCMPLGVWFNTAANDEVRYVYTETFPVVVPGLVSGKTYHCKVREQFFGDDPYEGPLSNWSNERAISYTTPGAAGGVSGARIASQTVRVSFTPPSNGGAFITDYDAQYSTSPTFASGVTFFEGGTTGGSSIDVTGLTNGTTYYFRVRATNAAGNGPWSAITGGVKPYTTPGTPTGISGARIASQTVRVSFTPPSNGGSPITDYDVQYSTTRTFGPGAVFFEGGTTTTSSVNVTGLTNGTTYYFRVRASNAAGDGPWSASTGGIKP